MGITSNCAKLLLHAKQLGVQFNETLMLGRQQIFMSQAEAIEVGAKFTRHEEDLLLTGYAEPFFKKLGATTVDSLDISEFEQATLIHDLNQPLGGKWSCRFSTVFDGGTLEHVFNFPVAIRNCIDMLKPGGHFISLAPSNNFCGHGFYQFSPELFFSIFNEAHGFRMNLVAMGVEEPGAVEEWFEVKDPHRVKHRVTVTNSFPTSLFIVAEKIRETNSSELNPFQSDYSRTWSAGEPAALMGAYRKWTPDFAKRLLRSIMGRTETQKYIKGLGNVNPGYFSKMDI